MVTKYIFIVTLFALLAFVWWRLFWRRKSSSLTSFPVEWRNILVENVSFYKSLDTGQRQQFESDVLDFLNDVTITGVEVEVDDRDRLLVASSAVIPLFGFPGWRYRNLNEVLLYPGSFDSDYQMASKDSKILGQVGTGAMQRMMILSKPALHRGFAKHSGKQNVGIHEFVHLLDKADGETDGIPEVLVDKQFVIPWLKMAHEEIERIKSDRSDFNPYGATNQAEFLSVISEYFFNRPDQFEKNHPDLFKVLEKMYRQDLDRDGSI